MSFGVTFADVTLGGAVNQVFTQTVDNKLIGKTDSTTTTIGSRAGATGDSYLTFSGSEDLGDGLKASFKLEPRVLVNGLDSSSVTSEVSASDTTFKSTTNTSRSNLFGANREAWIGLSGAFGSVNIGNNYTPLFIQAVAPFDPNGSTNSVGYLVSNVTTFNATNSIGYTAPKFVDGLGIQLNVNQAGGANNEGDSMGWGVSYAASGLSVGLAGENTKNTALSDGLKAIAAASSSNDLTKLGYGVAYDFGMAKVSLQGVNAKLDAASINTIGYGVVVPFGAFALKASMSNLTDKPAAGGAETKYSANQIGAYYALSKRTSAYLLNSNAKNTTASTTLRVTSIGVAHNF